jgi:hypothetical protein
MTIFISHATEDDSFVSQLREKLHARMFRTWVDHFDIPIGESWVDVIEGALAQSLLLLLVISKDSLNSHFVRKEWSVFLAENRRIIPIKVDDCETPMILRDLQHITFESKMIDDTALLKLLSVLPKRNTGILPPASTDHITEAVESPMIPASAGEGLSQTVQIAARDFDEKLTVELLEQPLILGRSDPDGGMVDIDLSLFDAGRYGVSRRHALLRYTAGGVTITDLSSKNGTFVDGYRVGAGENMVIHSGARVQLGRLELEIVNVNKSEPAEH